MCQNVDLVDSLSDSIQLVAVCDQLTDQTVKCVHGGVLSLTVVSESWRMPGPVHWTQSGLEGMDGHL